MFKDFLRPVLDAISSLLARVPGTVEYLTSVVAQAIAAAADVVIEILNAATVALEKLETALDEAFSK